MRKLVCYNFIYNFAYVNLCNKTYVIYNKMIILQIYNLIYILNNTVYFLYIN